MTELFDLYPRLDSIARDGVLGFTASKRGGIWARGKTPEDAAVKLAAKLKK